MDRSSDAPFYSEELSVEEQASRSPNLDMIRMLGFSWVARGSRNQNIDDLRRAMRLGRLLRQDDVTLEQDQAAVELVHMAVLAMNGMAVSKGDSRRIAHFWSETIPTSTWMCS